MQSLPQAYANSSSSAGFRSVSRPLVRRHHKGAIRTRASAPQPNRFTSGCHFFYTQRLSVLPSARQDSPQRWRRRACPAQRCAGPRVDVGDPSKKSVRGWCKCQCIGHGGHGLGKYGGGAERVEEEGRVGYFECIGSCCRLEPKHSSGPTPMRGHCPMKSKQCDLKLICGNLTALI